MDHGGGGGIGRGGGRTCSMGGTGKSEIPAEGDPQRVRGDQGGKLGRGGEEANGE